jgi:polysaccharide deacetylase family protein (PEP-CTERM system associated)
MSAVPARFEPVVESARFESPDPCNVLSVDVEDYFHVRAFSRQIDPATWDARECRIPRNLDLLLALFDRAGVKGTFFALGWVAERYPQWIRRIVAEGHELASHGYMHALVHEQTPDVFANDVARTKAILEDVGGVEVIGYRASTFSIDARSLWAFDVLQDVGYRYSSSVNPIAHDLYGFRAAPRFAFLTRPGGMLEVPLSTVRVGSRTLPCAGGGFFRLFPYAVFRAMLRRVNAVDRQPAVFYMHPWEIDPDQPRVTGIGVKSAFRHYLNLDRVEARLERLVRDFRWGRMDEVFGVRAVESALEATAA